ncbi:MAG: DUF1311 domain-containing protein [Paracoccaceae bacterium]|nr:DUF1311 domain-containing protein [Paracoccaceae bacterium]
MKGLARLICLAVLATPAMSQDLDYDPTVLATCLAQSDKASRHSCIGAASRACSETDAGRSTVGLGYCFSSEWEQWDAALNTAYQRLIVQSRERDADYEGATFQIKPSVPALRDMQRAWIGFRDAACTFEATRWGGGTGAGPASVECMMIMTVQQTLFLQSKIFQ